LWRHTLKEHKRFKEAYQARFSIDKGSNGDFEDWYRQYIVFCERDDKDECNNAFEALVLDVTINNDFEEQDSDCFYITFRTLSAGEAAFVNVELANKACAHLLTALTDATDTVTEACAYLLTASTDATDPTIEADLFMYSITAKLCYTSTVFIGIIINTNVSKKSTAGYRQF
jgi:hypothetical protein